MTFELLPLIDTMIAFYRLPKGSNRFNEYLQLLTEGTDDMKVPIPHFNPMAKAHVLEQLIQLQSINVEGVLSDTINKIRTSSEVKDDRVIKVSIAVADDKHGSWTNKHTADFAHRFDMDGYYKRNFCPVLLFTSESYTVDILSRLVEEACYRFILWNGKPETLKEHIEQEKKVNLKCLNASTFPPITDQSTINTYYEEHKDSSDKSRIFNFLYGDRASAALGYPQYGIIDNMAGLSYSMISS